ncbi:hypothetical protein DSL64_23005 [Dyadobacter luteus]|uniref:DUF5703 domain-containing protein n=1 Tax=Dyadobacter luteus TaxID=2259619 RepID=A0A3D8Y6V8_9BACT|nr:DUF5703 domain-containing protein [Dyadobacter luteus]REA57805.1 hypothetical protein DSL64_23005 [Dyadobacter luteus]
MKTQYFFKLAIILLVGAIFRQLSAQPSRLSAYDVVWNSQSKNSSESMPCGGGDVGLNVWVENGDVLFYLSRSGTFDENNQMLKLGRVRLSVSSDPFRSPAFTQRLQLSTGHVIIKGEDTTLDLWVDVFNPVVHIDLKSKRNTKINVAYESWRFEDHLIKGAEFRANSYKIPQKKDIYTHRDSIAFSNNTIQFFHRNNPDITNIFDYTVDAQGMKAVKSQMYNPLINNTFGGVISGNNLKEGQLQKGIYSETPYQSWSLESSKATGNHQVSIAMHVAQTPTLSDWQSQLGSIVKTAQKNPNADRQKTRAWWAQFWERSYIFIDGQDSTVSRNYQLFRYQLACNAYGKWPTKFNGGLFTFDPVFVEKNYASTPDFRLWGGGTFTAQNQRLVYFPMFKTGDFDMLKPQFDFYLNAQRNAELRSETYWKHKGASFTEQIENFGLPNIFEYGTKRPAGYDPGMEHNAWLEYQWETVFEFCLMMLETQRYENRDISSYIPFIQSCLTFYDEHYKMLALQRGSKALDRDGHLVLYPTSSAETYKMTLNSTTVISAMKVIIQRLLELPANYLSDDQRLALGNMAKRIPPVPLQTIDGRTTLAPAKTWERIQNTETPQLYPVFPWGIYGIGKPGLQTAIDTYRYDPDAVKNKSHVGWRQYSIFAARLGLAGEAQELTREKFKDGPHRFPTFWGPAFDWTPDHNWGGSAMIGLQEMLMQVDDKKILLLPAWPSDWNTSFKLHAPYQTVVEGRVENGKIVKLKVTPESRAADVIIHQPEK